MPERSNVAIGIVCHYARISAGMFQTICCLRDRTGSVSCSSLASARWSLARLTPEDANCHSGTTGVADELTRRAEASNIRSTDLTPI
jgi:hypothetical protein